MRIQDMSIKRILFEVALGVILAGIVGYYVCNKMTPQEREDFGKVQLLAPD